ncbi:MAG: glycine cleavage system protein T [Alphaproteobacteria bacterium]|nr:glycine cleavage system protein T [Alphaproteobacteria bacterium]
MPFSIHIGPNIRTSPYFEATVADGVRSFSVYNHMYIPGSYGDPDGEYDRLINGVAQWDVAAQRQIELRGPDAETLMRFLTPREIAGTRVGQGRYVPICDADGMLINDPVMLKLAEDRFWLSIADSDVELWAKGLALAKGLDVAVFEPDVSPMAVQGPLAEDVVASLFGGWVRDLKYFWFRETDLEGIPLVLARSGWSKQGGFELYLQDGSRGVELWERVKAAGTPFHIGPGAPNDVERVESGLLSYGADARRQTVPANPFELGLGKLVDLDRPDEFVGKAALKRIAASEIARRLTGFFVDGAPVPGIPAPLPVLMADRQVGTITEMIFSPRLERTIALGLIATEIAEIETGLTVEVAGETRRLGLSALPFLR